MSTCCCAAIPTFGTIIVNFVNIEVICGTNNRTKIKIRFNMLNENIARKLGLRKRFLDFFLGFILEAISNIV